MESGIQFQFSSTSNAQVKTIEGKRSKARRLVRFQKNYTVRGKFNAPIGDIKQYEKHILAAGPSCLTMDRTPMDNPNTPAILCVKADANK